MANLRLADWPANLQIGQIGRLVRIDLLSVPTDMAGIQAILCVSYLTLVVLVASARLVEHCPRTPASYNLMSYSRGTVKLQDPILGRGLLGRLLPWILGYLHMLCTRPSAPRWQPAAVSSTFFICCLFYALLLFDGGAFDRSFLALGEYFNN